MNDKTLVELILNSDISNYYKHSLKLNNGCSLGFDSAGNFLNITGPDDYVTIILHKLKDSGVA